MNGLFAINKGLWIEKLHSKEILQFVARFADYWRLNSIMTAKWI